MKFILVLTKVWCNLSLASHRNSQQDPNTITQSYYSAGGLSLPFSAAEVVINFLGTSTYHKNSQRMPRAKSRKSSSYFYFFYSLVNSHEGNRLQPVVVSYCMVLYGIVLYRIVLYRIVLYSLRCRLKGAWCFLNNFTLLKCNSFKCDKSWINAKRF